MKGMHKNQKKKFILTQVDHFQLMAWTTHLGYV
jgi:hypothetical protein